VPDLKGLIEQILHGRVKKSATK